MAGYNKKIAVIKQIKGGFSADGGAISGLVKAETYAGFLKVEVSMINFAPLTEGYYFLGITDGLNTVTFEGTNYEGESDFNLSCGFAFLVCFCHGGCSPIASATCGQMACALPDLKEEMAKKENFKPPKSGAAYEDDAIAEENYYEYKTDEDGGAVRAGQTQEKSGNAGGENEEVAGAFQGKQESGVGGKEEEEEEPAPPRLAGGDFYARMKGDVQKIFSSYPREEELEAAMENSRWAKISYAEGKYYVFGVLSVEGVPRYLGYGVPSKNAQTPPKSLEGSASYMPTASGGYWIMYQDATTGVSVKLKLA